MRTFFIIAAMFFVAAVKPIKSSNFNEKVLRKKDRVVVVEFGADWCAPCQVMEPYFKRLAERNRDVDFYKVNIDTEPALTAKYGVDSIPAILFVVNGKVVSRHTGLTSREQLQRMVDSVKSAYLSKSGN